jgi:hypothetical protein
VSIGQQLANQNLRQIGNKEFIIELLGELLEENRICAFGQAIENC